MNTLAAPRRRAPRFKLLICALVATAGLIAGWLSREERSQEVAVAPRRVLGAEERDIVVAAITQTLRDATASTIVWTPLMLTSREGVSDYCATVRGPDRDVGFYAQLVFPRADPREKLSRVNFVIAAVADNLEARYLVSVACLRYGYGGIMQRAP